MWSLLKQHGTLLYFGCRQTATSTLGHRGNPISCIFDTNFLADHPASWCCLFEVQQFEALKVCCLLNDCRLQSFYDAFMKDALDEVRADYMTAMHKSMLDYVLANPHERQRLALEGLEPLLAARWAGGPLGPPVLSASHQAVVRRHLPKDWRDHVALAR